MLSPRTFALFLLLLLCLVPSLHSQRESPRVLAARRSKFLADLTADECSIILSLSQQNRPVEDISAAIGGKKNLLDLTVVVEILKEEYYASMARIGEVTSYSGRPTDPKGGGKGADLSGTSRKRAAETANDAEANQGKPWKRKAPDPKEEAKALERLRSEAERAEREHLSSLERARLEAYSEFIEEHQEHMGTRKADGEQYSNMPTEIFVNAI